MAIKGLILDLDGVICDTADYHYKAWKRLAQEYNYNLDTAQNEQLKGVSRADSLKKIASWAKMDLSPAQFEEDMHRKNEWYLELVKGMTANDAFEGTGIFFNKAKILKYKLGLGSASKNAELVLTKLNLINLFDCIVDANTVINGKPNPETFLKAAELLNLKPEQCAVFEDSTAGIDAALAAGMFSIGIGNKQALPMANVVFPSLALFDFSVLTN